MEQAWETVLVWFNDPAVAEWSKWIVAAVMGVGVPGGFAWGSIRVGRNLWRKLTRWDDLPQGIIDALNADDVKVVRNVKIEGGKVVATMVYRGPYIYDIKIDGDDVRVGHKSILADLDDAEKRAIKDAAGRAIIRFDASEKKERRQQAVEAGRGHGRSSHGAMLTQFWIGEKETPEDVERIRNEFEARSQGSPARGRVKEEECSPPKDPAAMLDRSKFGEFRNNTTTGGSYPSGSVGSVSVTHGKLNCGCDPTGGQGCSICAPVGSATSVDASSPCVCESVGGAGTCDKCRTHLWYKAPPGNVYMDVASRNKYYVGADGKMYLIDRTGKLNKKGT